MNEGKQKLSLKESLQSEMKIKVWHFVTIYLGVTLAVRSVTLYQFPNLSESSRDWRLGAILAIVFLALPLLVVFVKRLASKFKVSSDAVSPVIGVILMVAITVVLAAAVFVAVQRLAQSNEGTAPTLSFQKQGASNYTLIRAPLSLSWGDFTVTGCTSIPTGSMNAGDVMRGCSGVVTVRHNPTNTVSWVN